MVQSQGLNIREGRTYLDVQSKQGTLSFLASAFGSGTYSDVGTKITEAGLEQPTMAQTAELVHGAWQNPKEKYSADIIQKLRSNWLWAFNGLLYAPNEGVYIQDRPEVRNGRVFMDYKDVVRKLGAKDSSVRFVPFGTFKRESQSSLEFAKNPFIQALAGEEGADKLAQVADKYRYKPCVWALDRKDVSQLTARVAGLVSRFIVVSRLGVVGGWLGYDGDVGCAFGVRQGEARTK
ncbi:hypothetical protein HY212_03130 [Candidatus Pacearchaeota archaeon]|nr:hypothetical protein [Candidatus Pacearchaeota archaeon]